MTSNHRAVRPLVAASAAGGVTKIAVTSVAPASIACRIGALLVKPPSANARVTPSRADDRDGLVDRRQRGRRADRVDVVLGVIGSAVSAAWNARVGGALLGRKVRERFAAAVAQVRHADDERPAHRVEVGQLRDDAAHVAAFEHAEQVRQRRRRSRAAAARAAPRSRATPSAGTASWITPCAACHNSTSTASSGLSWVTPRVEIVRQISISRSGMSCATNIPLIAPIDVPHTMSNVSRSVSAATTPASYAPRAPPPPRISARTGSARRFARLALPQHADHGGCGSLRVPGPARATGLPLYTKHGPRNITGWEDSPTARSCRRRSPSRRR